MIPPITMRNTAEPRIGTCDPSAGTRPRILTNMAFWQSPIWTKQTESIYDIAGRTSDPEFFPSWIEALKLFVRRSQADVVVTMGARASLAYGLLCAVANQASRQIMTEVFIDHPHPGSTLWLLKTRLYRLVANRCLGILTNSSAEVVTNAARFRVPAERLRYVPMHSNIRDPKPSGRNDGFVLAAGRTLRDYATFLKAAPRIAAPIIILCGEHDNLAGPLPQNVTLLRDVPRETYLDHVQRAAIIALPLCPAERSTGQVVLLEGMGFGKPVVTTRSPGTADIVRDGQNALFVEPGDANGWAERIQFLLGHPDIAQRIGETAAADVRRAYTFDIHAEAKLQAIRELWLEHRQAE